MAQSRDPRRSSIAIGGEKKKRGGLLWLLLGLLALIVAIALLIGSCGDDEEESAATSSAPAAAAPADPATPSTPTAPSAPTETSGATPAPETDGGTLTAASQSLLGDGVSSIGDQVGEDAAGAGVKVLSVSEAGFFVGTGDADRQFVEYGGAVGADESSKKLPAVGDTVDLTGPVRPAPDDPEQTLKLPAAEAEFVSKQGAYINADSVKPAAG